MNWKDNKDSKTPEWDTWESYMFKGYMSVGSSADKLIIYSEVRNK